MADRTCLAAMTEPGSNYPAYLSVNREADGRVSVTLRERGHDGNRVARMDMDEAVLENFALLTLQSLGYTIKGPQNG